MVRLGWHPCLRLNRGGTFRPDPQAPYRPVIGFVPDPGTRWRGTGTAFKSPQRRLRCTRLACGAAGDTEPWLILTDVPPEASDAGWSGLRAWIEHGVKITTRAGWPWQHTRMTQPARAARLWLAVAVATRWLLSVGGLAEETIPASTLLVCRTRWLTSAAALATACAWQYRSALRVTIVVLVRQTSAWAPFAQSRGPCARDQGPSGGCDRRMIMSLPKTHPQAPSATQARYWTCDRIEYEKALYIRPKHPRACPAEG
jgi:hypothetical protein